jgi:hypothetical protein
MVLPPEQVPHLTTAGKTGDDHFPPLHPYPDINAGNKECVTVPAELSLEPLADPHALPHRYPACELYIPVTPFGVKMGGEPGLLEEYRYPLVCNTFHIRSLLHSHGNGSPVIPDLIRPAFLINIYALVSRRS